MIVAGQVADMKNCVKNSTFRVAFCGIIAALGLVLMLLTSLVPVGTYAFPCFAGIFIGAVVIEYGWKWGLGVYAVVAVLSLFLAGDKEAVLYFIALFGYYPILKAVFEKHIKNKIILYILKFAVFNTAAIASFFPAAFLLSISPEEYTLFGVYMPLAFLAFGNVFFLVYDFAVTVFVGQYVVRLRSKFFGRK